MFVATPGLKILVFDTEAHWKAIRTINLLERMFGEGRRRTKVIPPFPHRELRSRLLYAILITASRSWRGVKM